jgi:hypothetical protein
MWPIRFRTSHRCPLQRPVSCSSDLACPCFSIYLLGWPTVISDSDLRGALLILVFHRSPLTLLPKLMVHQTRRYQISRYVNLSSVTSIDAASSWQKFLDTFICQANQAGIPYFYFEVSYLPCPASFLTKSVSNLAL